jgi:hypothetical protein
VCRVLDRQGSRIAKDGHLVCMFDGVLAEVGALLGWVPTRSAW